MPRPRFTQLDAAKQKALLEAAAKEFAEHGYEGASLNRIIGDAGLSKGGFYYYFDDKADLAATVFATHMQRYFDIAKEAQWQPGETFWDAGARYMKAGMEEFRRHPGDSDLLMRLWRAVSKHPHLATHLQPMLQQQTQYITELWRRGQEAGVVRKDLPVELLLAVATAIKEALYKVMIRPDAKIETEEFERLAAIQLDLIRRVAEPRPPIAEPNKERLP